MAAHDVDFRIIGPDMQFVEVELDPVDGFEAARGRAGVPEGFIPLRGSRRLFFASLTGPGRVWLQSLPFSRLADRIYKAAPSAGGSRREGGSILGGIGDLLDGDS